MNKWIFIACFLQNVWFQKNKLCESCFNPLENDENIICVNNLCLLLVQHFHLLNSSISSIRRDKIIVLINRFDECYETIIPLKVLFDSWLYKLISVRLLGTFDNLLIISFVNIFYFVFLSNPWLKIVVNNFK